MDANSKRLFDAYQSTSCSQELSKCAVSNNPSLLMVALRSRVDDTCSSFVFINGDTDKDCVQKFSDFLSSYPVLVNLSAVRNVDRRSPVYRFVAQPQ